MGKITWRMRVFVCTMILSLLLSTNLAYAASAPAPYYAALGDSIAFGIGATGWKGYVPRLKSYMTGATLSNQSFPGDKSSQLLSKIKSNLFTRAALKKATVITISIGGNNLLGCASSNYTVINAACAEAGIAGFSSDLPNILKEIRNLNPSAPIVLMTLYNPYLKNDSNYLTADGYITRINNIMNDTLNNGAAKIAYNYSTVDVYGSFGSGVNGDTCKLTHFCESTRDPHPKDAGHQLIADLHAILMKLK
ncbi:GDSL-type esterase/lipase family protein [Paenibacillus montanisoli]|uniref:SGNH hydrolase-type esterase domain-containing protein n=1 Tax=Paenibacillus montanisoli TaxID=2081970 RepID=A0A328TZ90_9BACL|nr:GDSL-type esterase/lipase family protein [Paenibacillus montanisoli]RAP75838.1 hypothetical protein DL346_10390 [Paenibacillus montanisoli]